MRELELFIIATSILVSCSTVSILPISQENRIPVKVLPLKDLTGQSQIYESLIDSVISKCLNRDIIEIVTPYSDDPSRAFSYIVYPNMIHSIRSSENIVPKFELSGEIELISYGSYQNTKEQTGSYAMFGLLGIALTNDPNKMVACVQYRIYLRDLSNDIVDNFVAVGVSEGDIKEKSRRQLTSEAIYNAANQYQIGLLNILSKHTKNIISQSKLLSQTAGVEKRTLITKTLFAP